VDERKKQLHGHVPNPEMQSPRGSLIVLILFSGLQRPEFHAWCVLRAGHGVHGHNVCCAGCDCSQRLLTGSCIQRLPTAFNSCQLMRCFQRLPTLLDFAVHAVHAVCALQGAIANGLRVSFRDLRISNLTSHASLCCSVRAVCDCRV
jgi:hypothetical protein